MLPSCEEVCRRIASDELAEAGLWERLMTRFHLWRCGDCSRYSEQLRTIGESVHQRAHEEGSASADLDRLEQNILDSDSARSSRRAGNADASND